MEQNVSADATEFEWQVILVPEDEEGPAFAFTVGLFESFEHPEILIMGLTLEMMHQILNSLGDEIRNGAVFTDGEESSGILREDKCAFRSIHPANYPEFLGSAKNFYGHANFPALQMFWPDKRGLFSWQIGFNEALSHHQQLLFEDTLA